jgi:hypothetical protein
MDVPTINVYRVELGFIPLTRYYHCVYCEHDLTDWVVEQPPGEPSACPNCEGHIAARDIAQAQRDTKYGCLWTIASIVGFAIAAAAAVGVIWLFTGPRPLITF